MLNNPRTLIGWCVVASTVLFVPWSVLAQNDVTMVLRSGQKVSGALASFDRSTVDLRDASGGRRSYPLDDVVLFDFVGGASGVPATELRAARDAGGDDVIFLRGSRTMRGRLSDFIAEGGSDARVVFESSDQGRQEIPLGQVGRIYVGTFTDQAYQAVGTTAAAVAGGPVSPTPAPAAGATAGAERTLTLAATSQWVDTGLTVRQGQRVGFETSGTITLRGDELQAGPAGAVSGASAPNAPIPTIPAGALIGRIGGGEPFGIGNQSSVPMPAGGRLFIGINDDSVADNRGQFVVRLLVSGS